VVERLIGRVTRRLDWRAAAEGAAIGVGAAALAALAGWPAKVVPAVVVCVGAAVVGTIIRILRTRAANGPVALYVERRVPESRNLIVTAHELGAGASTTYVRSLVLRRAAEVARTVNAGSLVPLRNAFIALVATTLVWLFALSRAGSPILVAPAGPFGGGARTATIDGVEVVVTPPAYSGQAPRTLRDPSRIEALAGSRLTINARARASSVSLETLTSRDSLSRSADGRFTSTLVAAADGYISLQPHSATQAGARRLIGLMVIPDAAPKVTIKLPGHDVRLPDGRRSLDVAIESSDDIGLASLRLHYTKVSGSGERFTFSEGDVPIAITRADGRTWSARVNWKLDPLELGPGDMVVYRAIAADQRPGAAPSESDSFIAEVMAAGGIAAAGFEIDPEQERYAVSQQMVILKTERLLARRATMPTADYHDEAADLAAEQRKVRAEFVFMLGGELADAPDANASMMELNEEAEAEGESDILAGRNANAGHVALLRAIRAMSRAATSLTVAELEAALPQERAALTQLESAFSHTRILLRAFSTRERLDFSRRLTGELADAAAERRPSPAPAVAQRAAELRRALADIASVSPAAADDSSATRLAFIAERVLRVDPGSNALQEVAQQLSAAGRDIQRGSADDARALLDRAAMGIATMLRGEFIEAPRANRSIDAARLAGALRDAQRGERRP
jgi:hypothetical protein